MRQDDPLELARAIAKEAADVLFLADQQLAWIDLHEGTQTFESGLVPWPLDTAVSPYNVQRALNAWHTRTGQRCKHGSQLVGVLDQLVYTLRLCQISPMPEARAQFGALARQTRKDASSDMRIVLGVLHKAVSGEE